MDTARTCPAAEVRRAFQQERRPTGTEEGRRVESSQETPVPAHTAPGIGPLPPWTVR